jgi:hypothetical protein
MKEVWQTAKCHWLIWIATKQGVLTDKELRLFAVWCARQVQHLMIDRRSINALDVAERYVNGSATDEELTAAITVADAAWAAADEAKAAAYAARAVAYAALAAADAAADAVWAAAYAACSACNVADAISERQAAWLRANCKPNFE